MSAKNADTGPPVLFMIRTGIMVALLFLLGHAQSWAHAGFHTKTIRALLKKNALYLSVQVSFPAGAESFRRRMRWDGNKDGRLDPEELDAVFDEIQAAYCMLAVTVNKIPQTLIRTHAGSMGLKGHTDSQEEISISFQFKVSFPYTNGISTLVIADRPKTGTHSPILLQAGAGVSLLKYSGRSQTEGSLTQLSYVLDQKHAMVISFVALSTKTGK